MIGWGSEGIFSFSGVGGNEEISMVASRKISSAKDLISVQASTGREENIAEIRLIKCYNMCNILGTQVIYGSTILNSLWFDFY